MLFAQCNNKECNGCVPIELTNHFPLSGLRCRVRTVYAHGCVPIELTNHLLRRSAFVQLSGSSILHLSIDPAFSIINVKLSKTKLETLRLLLLAVGSYPRARATRAACMEKIYEIPCAWAAWDLCAGSLLVKSTVLLLSVFWCNLVDPCILKTNRSKFTSNLDPVYGDACSAKSFGVRASRSWSYEIWLSIVWRLGWSWCSKAGEWTAKLFCIANHSAGLQVFGDLISLPCRGRAAAPRKAQKRPPGHAPGQSLFYSSFFTWKSPIWYATNGDFHYLFLSKSFSP